MLFSSPEFLFGFLPLSLLAFHLCLRHFGGTAAMTAAVLFSLFFYGWWNPPYLALLAGSVAVNFAFARRLAKEPSRWLLAAAVAVNLAVLGYFKYRYFFLENIGYVLGEDWSFGLIFIPLGISFFTFQQIALLIDANDGEIPESPPALNYAQFVVFFPQLIAGPIVLYRELAQQLNELRAGRGEGLSLLGPGIVVFLVGLFKKVCLADGIAPFADTAFTLSSAVSTLEAWGGGLAYSLQLYFDFSGYSDMAVGLGLMFGLKLPLNFDTPFRATSMIDFWKRWHITMTRFFMLYVYAPLALALTRFGLARIKNGLIIFAVTVFVPIVATFLLSGLWHGAGWSFVVFGGVNGLGLVVNHAWREARLPPPPAWLGWGLTMLTVLVSFVYFRAGSIETAHDMLTAMFSPAAFLLPNWLSGLADALGLPWATLFVFSTGTFTVRFAAWVAVLGLLSLVMPNPAKTYGRLVPSPGLAVATGAMAWMAIGWLDEPRSFLYFQF